MESTITETYIIDMTNNLLLLGMGAGELIILIIFFIIPFVLKFVFVAELNDFLHRFKNSHNESVPKFTWILAIPIISVIYIGFYASKIDRLISAVTGKDYKKYYSISKNIGWIIILFILKLGASQSNNESDNYLLGILSLIILILIIMRITNGIIIYFDIKEINKSNLNTAVNSPYSGGYDGGHNASNSSDSELINPPINKDGGYQNGNLYN